MTSAHANSPALSASTDPATVWERLWCHRSDPTRDTVILDRERRSARWTHLVDRITIAFGGIESLRIVELGSGRGDLSVLLAQCGAQVTLVDSCAEALRQASDRFTRLGLAARFEQHDIFDFAERRTVGFDVAVSSGVVEHFRDDDRTRVIRAHHDALRPGGLAVISVPHAWCLPYRAWKAYLGLRGWWPYGFEKPYTRRELRRRAVEAGLQDVSVHGLAFLHSVGVHWWQRWSGSRPGWADGRCFLDNIMGSSLLLLGRRRAC